MSAPDTGTAVARELAWLTTTGDGLPSLLTADGGPWQVISPWPRTPNAQQKAIYVSRGAVFEDRWANQRKKQTYEFRARLLWPLGSTTLGNGGNEIAASEQDACDDAVDALLTRIRGFLGDHTHGGRFLSVAEAPDPPRITVRYDDPEATLRATPIGFKAWCTWSADDHDFTA